MNKLVLFASVASVIAVAFDTCETVLVKSEDGKGDIRVNKSDYDADQADGGEKRYTLSSAKAQAENVEGTPAGVVTPLAEGVIVPPAPSAPDFAPATDANGQPVQTQAVPPVVPSPGAKLVKKQGKKYVVVLADGSKVEDVEGIDKAGYDTEAAAWTAVMALPH